MAIDEELNFVDTSGEFGRVRRLPTFIIERTDRGMIRVTDERDPKYLWQGPSLERAMQAHQYQVDRRTMDPADFRKKYPPARFI